VSLALGGAPCQCAAWGSEGGGRCDASIAKRNIKWEGRETKKLNGILLSDELGFWYSIQRGVSGALYTVLTLARNSGEFYFFLK